MIYGFYFRFYKITHSKSLSIVLSYLARFVLFLRFQWKRLLIRKKNIELAFEDAIKILNDTSPKPTTIPDYVMQEIDPDLDLSIIIPIYNHIHEIGDCINSAINQKTKYRYEIILVDDGSTDGAQDYIEQFNKTENIVIIHQDNGGIAAARNTGIKYSKGKYLMFVDCDDVVKDTIVEKLMSQALYNDYDIVMGAHNLVKKSGHTITQVIPNIYPQKNLLGYKNNDEIMNYAGLPWAKVYKRELFEKVRFFPGYWYEDTIIQFLLFTQCKSFGYVPEPVYDYFWYEGNFSHVQAANNAKPKAVDRYWLLAEIVRHYEELNLPMDDQFYTLILKHVSAYYYRTFASLPEEVVNAMFISGRDLLLKNKPAHKVNLPYMLRLSEKAMIEKNIELWKLCCNNQ